MFHGGRLLARSCQARHSGNIAVTMTPTPDSMIALPALSDGQASIIAALLAAAFAAVFVNQNNVGLTWLRSRLPDTPHTRDS